MIGSLDTACSFIPRSLHFFAIRTFLKFMSTSFINLCQRSFNLCQVFVILLCQRASLIYVNEVFAVRFDLDSTTPVKIR